MDPHSSASSNTLVCFEDISRVSSHLSRSFDTNRPFLNTRDSQDREALLWILTPQLPQIPSSATQTRAVLMSQVRHRSEIPPQKSEKMRYPQRISKMAIILRTSLSWLSFVFRKGLLMLQERDRRGETREEHVEREKEETIARQHAIEQENSVRQQAIEQYRETHEFELDKLRLESKLHKLRLETESIRSNVRRASYADLKKTSSNYRISIMRAEEHVRGTCP
ncbi:hypothetical protein TNIN_114821 [Trichonephila inaurata madagascariensis]|uniref:Uncharacterized protein n=1 Tax=Trichonephila inaurata madagascariensis TaxID=2747483 RepID=A0A8X6YIR2_9ARAC|nr:hypothetical protein TNIN_114821 [Trichonephila inaurata madagascariensis]